MSFWGTGDSAETPQHSMLLLSPGPLAEEQVLAIAATKGKDPRRGPRCHSGRSSVLPQGR